MFGPKNVVSPSSSRACSPPDRLLTRVSPALAGKPDRADTAAHLGFGRIRHQLADVVVGRTVEIELVDLMLREIADRESFGARDPAGEGLQLVGQQLDQRRLAIAVEAQQRDAVVGVDAQGDAIEHRLFRT